MQDITLSADFALNICSDCKNRFGVLLMLLNMLNFGDVKLSSLSALICRELHLQSVLLHRQMLRLNFCNENC